MQQVGKTQPISLHFVTLGTRGTVVEDECRGRNGMYWG